MELCIRDVTVDVFVISVGVAVHKTQVNWEEMSDTYALIQSVEFIHVMYEIYLILAQTFVIQDRKVPSLFTNIH